jgi:hypothetical protein
VFLVPGFFGFANFGDFRYFAHVRELLEAELRARGLEAAVHYAPTFPTASLRRRAGRLIELIDAAAGADDGPIHLIGHSTGGLDARLAVAPRVSLVGRVDPEPLARRVRTIVAVTSPHHGTPTAAFFASLLGQRLLFLLSLVTMQAIRLGTIPLPALVVLASALGSTGAGRLIEGGLIEQVYALVLKDFSPERRAQIEKVFSEVQRDQTLLVQLTPESLDLFNALATEREGVKRGCVVAQARPPSLKNQLRVGPSPTHQAMYNVFRALYAIASTLPERVLPTPDDAQADALIRAFGRVPSAKGNDAMVPTRSQVWGTIIHAAWADHLDVIGHFHAPERAPLHVDWMRTGSDFGRAEFETMWRAVARFAFDGR